MRLSNINIDKYLYKKQTKVAFFGFLTELPNLIVEVINALFSNSLFLWADCLGSFQSTLHCFIVFIFAHRIEKETGETYNFGIDRLETLTSLICNFLIAIGYIVIVVTAVLQLFTPIAPTGAIVYFLIIKATNIAVDIYFYIEKWKIEKKGFTRLNQTEVSYALENLFCDVLVGIVVCVCYFFRTEMWSWYISPIASIVMATFFLVNCAKRIRNSVFELSDKSFSIIDQDKVFDIVLSHTDLIEKIININCRTMNNKYFIDINVVFNQNTTYEQQLKLLLEVNKEIQTFFANSSSRFIIESN